MNARAYEFTVVISALLMRSAAPRPASTRTSDAMFGWIPKTDTDRPVQAPSTNDTRSATTTAMSTVRTRHRESDSAIVGSATAAETAMMAPTDRAMPLLAMTVGMPRAIRINGAE